MADSLFDILDIPSGHRDDEIQAYLAHLAGLSVPALDGTEVATLSQSSHSLLITTQGLSKRSHQPIIKSITKHEALRESLRRLGSSSSELQASIPRVDLETVQFSGTFSKSSQHETMAKRRRDLLLLRNVERLVDIFELPTLLSTTITSGSLSHSSALDLSAHVRRLRALYPNSPLIASVAQRADALVFQLTSDLITSLGSPGLKLAPAMRTTSLLRRIIPDILPLAMRDAQEKTLGTLFILRRISTLELTLEALEPLRQLAEDDKTNAAQGGGDTSWSGGQHAERYLKRYIEIFREHSFGMVSMFKSVFISQDLNTADPLEPLPNGLSTLLLYLLDRLLEVLGRYLPVVSDQGSRDSILTQVLYCAGSLGRLGGDFGNILFGARSRTNSPAVESEWVDVAKRHRLLTARLESVLGDFKASAR